MAGTGNRTQIAGTQPAEEAPGGEFGWDAVDEEAIPTPARPGRAGWTPSQGPSGLELEEIGEARRAPGADDDLEAAIPTAWSPHQAGPTAGRAGAAPPLRAPAGGEQVGEEFDFGASRSAPPSAAVEPPRDLGSLPAPGAGTAPRPPSGAPPSSAGVPGTEFALGGATASPRGRGSTAGAVRPPMGRTSDPASPLEPALDVDHERARIGRGDSMAALDLDQRARPAHLGLGADLEIDTTALVEARHSRRAMARAAERRAFDPDIPRAAPIPIVILDPAPPPEAAAPERAYPAPEPPRPVSGPPEPARLPDDDALGLPSAPPVDRAPPPDDGARGRPSAPSAGSAGILEVPELEVPVAPRFARPAAEDRAPLPSPPPERTAASSAPPDAPAEGTGEGTDAARAGAGQPEGSAELTSERPRHPPRSPVPPPPPDSFDMDLDEVPGDAVGATLELASSAGSSPSAAPDGRPLPTGRTPDAAALAVTRDQATRLARFGEPPNNALLTPLYAVRVLVRRRLLAAETQAAGAALARAERDRDLVLAEVFVKFRDQLRAVVKLPEPVEPLRSPEAAANEQQREFAQVSAEYQQRQRALTVRGTHAEQVVAALRQAEAARAEVLAQRRGDFNRVAARFQRLQIEHRNARQAEAPAAKAQIARASTPPPSELAPQTARIEIQLGKLYPVAKRLQAAMEEAQRELSAAEQATREAEGRIKLIEAERKAVDLWYAKQTRHVDASLADAEGAYVTARADMVRAALSIGSAHLPTKTLELLRDQDERVRELAFAHRRLVFASGSYDAERYRQGLLSGGALLGALLLLLLLVILF